MRKLSILTVSLLVCNLILCQSVDRGVYVELTLSIIQDKEFLDGLDNDTIFINSNGIKSNFDTIIGGKLFLFVKSQEELATWNTLYWFETDEYEANPDNIDYAFSLNSWRKQEDFTYREGKVEFKRWHRKWIVSKKKIREIEYNKLSQINNPRLGRKNFLAHKRIKEFTIDLKNVDKRNFINLNDTLNGNWQGYIGKDYVEFLFYNDTIYTYSLISGKQVDYQYSLDGYAIKIVKYNDVCIKWIR